MTEEHWNLLGFMFVIIALYAFYLCKNFIIDTFGMETYILVISVLVVFIIGRMSRLADMANSVYAFMVK